MGKYLFRDKPLSKESKSFFSRFSRKPKPSPTPSPKPKSTQKPVEKPKEKPKKRLSFFSRKKPKPEIRERKLSQIKPQPQTKTPTERRKSIFSLRRIRLKEKQKPSTSIRGGETLSPTGEGEPPSTGVPPKVFAPSVKPMVFNKEGVSISTVFGEEKTRYVYCCRIKDEFNNWKTITISSRDKYVMNQDNRKILYQSVIAKYPLYSFQEDSISLFLIYDRMLGKRYEY